MASVKNITMHEYNGTDYDTLYPKTIASQVDGVYSQTETNALLADKAPNGYGLGGVARWLEPTDDLNNAKTTGWYRWFNNPVNGPGDFGAMTVVVNAPDGRLVQEVVFVLPKFNGTYHYNVNCKVRRICYQNTWQPWEWENPPMMLGVEYRTTERYLGKPVYTKLVNFGALPKASTSSMSHNIENIDFIVSAIGRTKRTSDGWTFTFPSNPSLSYESGMRVNKTGIDVGTMVDWSGFNLYVTMKYTKTTD